MLKSLFKNRNKTGFTLIEALVVIAIFTSVLGIATGFIIMLYQTYYWIWEQTIAISEARKGIEIMVRQIRNASFGDNGSHIIEKADNFEFIFFSNIDGDRDIERVRYFVQQAYFKKGIIDPVGFPVTYPLTNERIHIISEHVRNLPPIFRYFDIHGNELLAPARLKDTRLMKVKLIINVNPLRLPEDFHLESNVQIRNLI
jgi:prepilin-type N-terminal cleavage/methylation domain-containing protein